MTSVPSLGDQELEVLRYVTDRAPITVREVAASFGEERGLARTTILTVMERLRKKGYLKREQSEGSFQYRPVVEKTQLMQNLVQDFVEKTLGGSLSPFVAYLANNRDMAPHEVDELRRLVAEMERKED